VYGSLAGHRDRLAKFSYGSDFVNSNYSDYMYNSEKASIRPYHHTTGAHALKLVSPHRVP
jgi:hypothetical protein